MKRILRSKSLSFLFTFIFMLTYIVPSMNVYSEEILNYLPTGFTSVAIGKDNFSNGNANFDKDTKVLTVSGSGNQIGKDPGSNDSYEYVSYKVIGDISITARLTEFDMSKASNGQAGVFIRSTNDTDNADYFGVYVDPAMDAYRYAYRDASDSESEKGGTGAESIEGLTSNNKNLYIKLVKKGQNFKYYISEDPTFPEDNTLIKGQDIGSDNNGWYVGFAVNNGDSTSNAIAQFDNISINDGTGVVFDSNTFVVPNLGYLPDGFINSAIGNDDISAYANFDKINKNFTIDGSGTYIGKDISSTDNYHFVNYKVEGDATITARLSDFNMENAQYGQTGVFMRADNSSNNADYFGVYVEPSKNQYRYAFRDNSISRSGAAAINGLTAESKNNYIKIVKEGNIFRYYISEDPTFPSDKTVTNAQTINTTNNTWYVGLVVSNGGSETPAVATYDNVKIETADKIYYDSTLEERPVDAVENLGAVAGDSKVTLSWDNVEGATSYIVKRATAIDGNFEEVATVTENNYVDTTVINFTNYFYKVVAANEEGTSNDSQIIRALPNNSNPLNLQYEENAAKFTMTQEPNDTVFTSNIKIAGYTDKDGIITVKQNGKTLVDSVAKEANDTFEQLIKLIPGRNDIQIYQTTNDGKTTLKSYNIVYLNNEGYDIVVDSNYTGKDGEIVDGKQAYSTVTAAINSVSTKNTERVVILVKNGTYKEKITVQSPYVSLIGEDSEKTILTYDAANGTVNPETGKNYGTSGSASITIKSKAKGFTAENLTIENSFVEQGNNNEQAVALNNQADESIFINTRFVGNQDTLLADASSSSPARQYYYKCYIEGDVDFIFGRAQAVFDDCDIASVNRGSTSNNGYVTAADTWDRDQYGYLIINSRLIGLNNIANNTVSLGRPWRPSSQTEPMTPAVTYVNTYMGDHITTKGWDDMGDSLAATADFSEFGSFGPGAKLSDTRKVLSVEEASKYTLESVFATDSATVNDEDAFAYNWNPQLETSSINIHDLYGKFIPVTSVILDSNEITLTVGDTKRINVVVGPEDASDKTITFVSEDNNIATVDENGNIIAMGDGATVINVKAGDITESIIITVNPKFTLINRVPEISAEDVVIKVGEIFDVMNTVTANDYEDGDITSNIEVIENTVDTANAGEYKVVYKVTDSKGASVTKEIMVTVEAVITDSEVTTPDNSIPGDDNIPSDDNNEDGNTTNGNSGVNDNNNTENNLPQTGGTSSVIVISLALIVMVAGIFILKKKKNK